jgi:Flp pilus assembly protein TadD
MKRTIAFLLLGLSLMLWPALAKADPKTDAAKWVQYGNRQYQAKQFDGAIQSFNNALKLDKTSAAAYQGLAYCYYYKGNKDYYQRYMQYANYYKTQAPAAAAAPASSGAAAYIEQGKKYLQARQYPYAAWAFNKATQAEANNAQAWQGLGTAYAYQGNKAKAVEAFNRSLALQPNPQLQAYVDNLKGGAGGEEKEAKQEPWVPYAMGAAVVVLGAIMIFLF